MLKNQREVLGVPNSLTYSVIGYNLNTLLVNGLSGHFPALTGAV
jgi:hypothetical protein